MKETKDTRDKSTSRLEKTKKPKQPKNCVDTLLGALNVPTGWQTDVRQMAFPREFRIDEPAWTPEMIEVLRKARAAIAQGTVQTTEQEVNEVQALLDLVAEFATGLWRIRQKVDGDTVSQDALRAIGRRVQSTWDALTSARIEVRDHTGDRFVDGMALKVVAFQPMEGVQRETIVETIRPSVYYKDRLIQRGEVVVGTPLKEPQAPADRQTGPSSPNETG